MIYTVTHEHIPLTDSRLKRHVRHDSRSRMFAHPTKGITVKSVAWKRVLAILNQGQIGACTANAGIGTLGTQPYAADPLIQPAFVAAFGTFDENGALALYSAEETLDGDGPYPPNDNGSSGVTLASVLKAAGIISGYTHTFSLDDNLKALQTAPINVGIPWYNSMFNPDGNGLVTVDFSSGIAGGHEIEEVEFDATTNLVKFANSWGEDFGDDGYFYLSTSDLGKLLKQNGDSTIFTPPSMPAPVPSSPIGA